MARKRALSSLGSLTALLAALGCGAPPSDLAADAEIDATTAPLGVTAPGTVNLDTMASHINQDLSGNAVGYAFAIVKSGVLARSGSGGVARRAFESGGGLAMTSTRRLQIASVTKTITAVAVLQLLEASGKSIDDLVLPYLPASWVRGLGIHTLTFRQLLTHTSGFDQAYQGLSPADQAYWDNDWDGLEFVVSNGASPGSPYGYRNANFALFRVLIPALWKQSPMNPGIGVINEGNYAGYYLAYVRQYVLQPAGVLNVECESQDPAIPSAYGYDVNAPFTTGSSGNVTSHCGGHAGLHLSARDLAAFMAHVRYNNAVLSPANRLLMDSNKLGFSPSSNSGAALLGKYFHGGDWYSGSREWHTCIMKYPQSVEAALVVNSAITTGSSACTILKDAFNDAL